MLTFGVLVSIAIDSVNLRSIEVDVFNCISIGVDFVHCTNIVIGCENHLSIAVDVKCVY